MRPDSHRPVGCSELFTEKISSETLSSPLLRGLRCAMAIIFTFAIVYGGRNHFRTTMTTVNLRSSKR